MRFIKISRECGSGGREIGKRLADLLGFDYYDKEIITVIAAKQAMDENYVMDIRDNHVWKNIPLTISRIFSTVTMMHAIKTDLLLEQTKGIKELAKTEKDCVIVGRNADVLLKSYQPFNSFVCVKMRSKIRRCMERATKDEKLSSKEMERKSIDKNRAAVCEINMNRLWVDYTACHITVNVSDWNLKERTTAVSAFVECWFGRVNYDSAF